MNDLLIPGLILAALAFSIASAGFHRVRRLRKTLRQRQTDSIQLIRLLKELLSQIQNHRGLVSVLLNGDTRKRSEITDKQDEITRSFQYLARHHNPTLLTPTRMQRICDYWQDIVEQLTSLTAEQSFDRHSALIRQVLFQIGDTADNGQLQELPEIAQPLVTLWANLPAAAETIGQARAVGAGVAAAGHCDSVARIKLRYLHQRVAAALDTLAAQPESAASTCPGKVEHLLNELEQHLLLPAKPTISAAHYFQLASEALNAVYGLFEQANARLEQHFVNRTA